jgi:flagellum-specific peptidoglycan hydrolase FlgJ
MKLLLWISLFAFRADEIKLNKVNLWNTIQESGIQYPDIVYAQAILESGNLKSKLVKRNNNLFGMRKPSKRKTTAVGIKSKYAVYTHWTSSVHDYKLWQQYLFRKKMMSRKQYLSYIQKRYSETPNYVSRVLKIIKNQKYETRQKQTNTERIS